MVGNQIRKDQKFLLYNKHNRNEILHLQASFRQQVSLSSRKPILLWNLSDRWEYLDKIDSERFAIGLKGD